MVSLRFFFKKTSVQKHYTEIVKNGIAFMLSLTRTHSLCETENLLPIISDTFFFHFRKNIRIYSTILRGISFDNKFSRLRSACSRVGIDSFDYLYLIRYNYGNNHPIHTEGD